MEENKGLRRFKREALDVPVEVIWKTRSGEDQYAKARALDVSESGMRLEMPVPLDERIYVTIRAEGLGLHGRASVRSCSKQSAKKFWIGLEFSGGLKWRPKTPRTD